MARKTILTCDRCGRRPGRNATSECSPKCHWAKITVKFSVYLYDDGTDDRKEKYNFCAECRDEIRRELRRKVPKGRKKAKVKK